MFELLYCGLEHELRALEFQGLLVEGRFLLGDLLAVLQLETEVELEVQLGFLLHHFSYFLVVNVDLTMAHVPEGRLVVTL